MVSQLEALARHTVIVADTGELSEIARLKPQDATTNPSLLLKAASDPAYAEVIDEARAKAARRPLAEAARAEAFVDELLVAFGCRILEIVPGRVSTEVDARLSFDSERSIAKARRLVELYGARGIERERVLIKVASTWEGIAAARALEREGIHTNLTLLFSLAQAVAAAEAGATLISPFVGRIYDWHLKQRGAADIPNAEDPGVASVEVIYDYLKKFGYPTEVMGASFRKAEQVTALCGCDLLTISPELLDELAERSGDVPRRLDPARARAASLERIASDEASFRWRMNEDAMATEKLAEGIRRFHADGQKLLEFARESVAS